MARIKICPSCGTENDPSSMECLGCGMDIASVKLTDTEAAPPQPESINKNEPTTDSDMVRICECGAINPVQVRKCTACGEDISDIVPTLASLEAPCREMPEATANYMLSSIFGDFLFRVPFVGAIIGREHGMRECLADKRFVSRTHARLMIEDGDLYIENLSTTNYTYVNNIRIPEGKTKLKVGDELGLGGIVSNGVRQDGAAYFIVGLSP